VHHIQRGTFDIGREANDPVERQILRQRDVHLGHVLEAGPILADQLFVHVHDDVVVLGVDRGDAAGLRQHLQESSYRLISNNVGPVALIMNTTSPSATGSDAASGLKIGTVAPSGLRRAEGAIRPAKALAAAPSL
jgi:hypothetical protein